MKYEKPRVIHTTDLGADPDDEESMVRVMVTSNEFDLEGLIVVTSCWKTHQESTSMLDKIVDAYGEVLNNLMVHAKGYPSYEYLKSISRLGQPAYGMAGVGEGKDSSGSDLIITALEKDDPRPLWVALWGGANTLAQALWKIRNTCTPEQTAQLISKLRVYDVLGQDDAGAWIVTNFPELFYIRARNQVYGLGGGNFPINSNEWLAVHVGSHGPLGACYTPYKWCMEGDTPSFLYLYPNGLNDPEKIDQGSWGGRFYPNKQAGVRGMTGSKVFDNEATYDPYYMYSDAEEGGAAIARWREDIQHDLAARMDWSITSTYTEANHHPVAVVNGDTTKHIIEIKAAAGSAITLSAAGSCDPDGDALAYSWWYYNEPSSYQGTITIENSSAETATVAIPSDAGGKTIHIILEVHDNGTPPLCAYRRVIINVQ